LPKPIPSPAKPSDSMSAIQRTRLGARVILLKPGEQGGLETFLTPGPEDISSFGFPGGVVEKQDYSSGMLKRCRGLSGAAARKIMGAHLSPQQAMAPWVAAIRSLFLEVGVLLAVDESGQDPMRYPNWWIRMQSQRAALRAGRFSFESLLVEHGLWADIATLRYFSSWRLSNQESTDVDSHFYLVTLPHELEERYSVLPTGSRAAWLRPDRAILLCAKGELAMDFSTFASLRTLADFNSMESLVREYGHGRRP